MFEAAGLGVIEEEVYTLLLDARALSLDDLSRSRSEPSVVLTRALDRLEASGLVTRGAGTPQRYVPSPPDLAIEALVLRRHGELEQLRAHATALARKYWAARERSDSSLVQVVRGAEAVRQHSVQIQRAARREVTILDRPPYPADDVRFNNEELVGLGRGVRYRCIYDATLLDDEERVHDMFRYVDAGEQARTLADVPLKMMVADAEVAIVPLVADEPAYHDCAIVRGSTLISALTTCFDALWGRSVPLSTGAGTGTDPAATTDEESPSALERRIVRMLAAGIKDAAIARQLDVSNRTINRYMDRVMGKLGASTRFQAGLQAARHGWL